MLFLRKLFLNFFIIGKHKIPERKFRDFMFYFISNWNLNCFRNYSSTFSGNL
jgi:hypothetical protein